MPRTYSTTHTVYKFEELSDEAKSKAIDNLYDINVDSDWWEFAYDDIENDLKEIGITIQEKHRFYFEIDRGSYFHINKPIVTNTLAFLKAAGIPNAETIAPLLSVHLSSNSFRAGESNTNHAEIDVEYLDDVEFELDEEKLSKELSEFINDKCEDYIILLRKELEYLTSREAIIDTIEANEYEFTENGKLA